MFNPIKLYRKSQQFQIRWIANHPVQYFAINAILIVGVVGYIEYEDRKALRKFEQDARREFDRLVKID